VVVAFGGRYEEFERIGAGAMGEVWRASDMQRGGRPVAVKVMHSHVLADPDGFARFQREMRLAAMMKHPDIMSVLATGTDGGTPFMVMEYLEGRDLDKVPRGMGADQVVRIGRDVCDALAYAHGQGVVHRDIKPSNLFLCDSGQVKVTDFGIAKAVGGTKLTATGVLVGTFAYMAPEQLRGEPAAFSNDIWAVGCVLYEFISGRLPLEYSTPVEYIAAAQHGVPITDLRRIARTPAWLAAAVMAMLERDPRRRPSAADCLRLLSGSPTATAPPLPPSPPPPSPGDWRSPAPPPSPGDWRSSPTSAPPPATTTARARTATTRRRRKVRGPLVAAAVILIVPAAVASWLLNRPTWVPATGTAYVTDSRGIVPINLETGQAENAIGVTGSPYGIALSPDHPTSGYVIDETTCRTCTGTVGISSVLPVNLATGASGKDVVIGSAQNGSAAFRIALAPDGRIAYSMTDSGMVPVNLATGSRGTVIKVGNASSEIAVAPDSATAYVTTDDNKDLVPVDLSTGHPGEPIKVGSPIGAIAIAPDGATGYVYDDAGVASIDLATGRVGGLIKASWGENSENGPSVIAVTPDGKTAYVNGGSGVVPINLETMHPGPAIGINDMVMAIVIAPDGKAAYAGGWSGTIYPIDIATNRVGKTISAGNTIQFMTVSP
jgi:serine/threonine protein kinase/DNA-binding beta-propeller fold protein YncE